MSALACWRQQVLDSLLVDLDERRLDRQQLLRSRGKEECTERILDETRVAALRGAQGVRLATSGLTVGHHRRVEAA